jgi:hypothetical protein
MRAEARQPYRSGLKMTITDRTPEVLSLLRCKLSLSRSLEDLLDDYKQAHPFPHLLLDNLFPSAILDSILEELPPASREKWVNHRNELVIKSNFALSRRSRRARL